MPQFSGWLVVDPPSEDVRFVKRQPSLRRGEVAFPITVVAPDSSKRLLTDKPIILRMPGYTEAEVIITGEPESVELAELQFENTDQG